MANTLDMDSSVQFLIENTMKNMNDILNFVFALMVGLVVIVSLIYLTSSIRIKWIPQIGLVLGFLMYFSEMVYLLHLGFGGLIGNSCYIIFSIIIISVVIHTRVKDIRLV